MYEIITDNTIQVVYAHTKFQFAVTSRAYPLLHSFLKNKTRNVDCMLSPFPMGNLQTCQLTLILAKMRLVLPQEGIIYHRRKPMNMFLGHLTQPKYTITAYKTIVNLNLLGISWEHYLNISKLGNKTKSYWNPSKFTEHQ